MYTYSHTHTKYKKETEYTSLVSAESFHNLLLKWTKTKCRHLDSSIFLLEDWSVYLYCYLSPGHHRVPMFEATSWPVVVSLNSQVHGRSLWDIVQICPYWTHGLFRSCVAFGVLWLFLGSYQGTSIDPRKREQWQTKEELCHHLSWNIFITEGLRSIRDSQTAT